MKKVSICLLLFSLTLPISFAQTFMKAYGSPGDDQAFSVQQTSDGGFIIGGLTSGVGAGGQDVLLVKFDGSGAIQWS